MKTVKTRKPHACCGCGDVIQTGETAFFGEGRTPVLDELEIQTGIQYFKFWMHTYRCDLTPEQREDCQNGQHEWEDHYEFDGFDSGHAVYLPTSADVCKICGIVHDREL